MKRLFVIIILLALLLASYLFFRQWTASPVPTSFRSPVTSELSLSNPEHALSNLESVLGDSISSGVTFVTDSISTATAGRSDPIINQAISNFQTELSKLPEDQMKKIQYNYCKSIVEEYESQSNN